MLEGLDRIDWGRLTHAYGRAGDVPDWIRALTSEDRKVREKGLGQLHANICHQGSRYRSSAPAVPFLFEVLEAPGTRDRAELIALLVGLAVGYPEWHVPLGYDPEKPITGLDDLGSDEERERVRAVLGSEEERERIRALEPDDEDEWEPSRIALWAKDAHDAVLARLPVLQRLLRDDERAVRLAAVKALAWFPEAAESSAPLVRAVAPGAGDPDERANALLCLGILDRYRDDRSDRGLLVAALANDQPATVRTAAAISLAVVEGPSAPAGCLATLLEAVQDPNRTTREGGSANWHWLGLAAHASQAILLLRPGPTETVVAALCRAAEAVTEPMAGAHVFGTLLGLVIPDPGGIARDPKTGFRRLDPAGLTPAQRQALRAIGRSTVWDIKPFFYGQLMDVGLEYGLPWDPERFRDLLAEVNRTAPDRQGS